MNGTDYESELNAVRVKLSDQRTSDSAFFAAQRRERTILLNLADEPAMVELKAKELSKLIMDSNADEHLVRSLARSILRALGALPEVFR